MRQYLAFAALLAAMPVAAAEPVRLGDGSEVVRAVYADLKTPQGRAAFHRSLEVAAARICADVKPRRSAADCRTAVVRDAEARALPQVALQLRLARQEAQTIQLAGR